MTVWDVVNEIVKSLSPLLAALLLVSAGVVVIIGFSRHGINFFKYGFNQKVTGSLGEKIDGIAVRLEAFRTERAGIHTEMGSFHAEMAGIHAEMGSFHAAMEGIHTELETIKINHFRHLKNYLGVLNGILLDKEVIDNKDKALLDNELDGM
jgi:hypothetical protein